MHINNLAVARQVQHFRAFGRPEEIPLCVQIQFRQLKLSGDRSIGQQNMMGQGFCNCPHWFTQPPLFE